MKDKSQGSIKLAGFLAALALTVLMTLGVLGGFGSAEGIKLGLDLAGGVSITYETVKEDPTQTEVDDTIYKMQQRADNYSTESAVYQEGDRRVVVDIPGVQDANRILEELGNAGSIQFIPVEGNMTLGEDGYTLDYTIEELYEKGQVVIDGSDITTASPKAYNDTIGVDYIVILELNASGANKFAKATEEYLGQEIAIVYDGKVISWPTVQNVISDGTATISGQRDMQEASNLASTIRIGALPLELKEVRSNVVGAKLGEEAIQTSLLAGAVGLILIFLFMIVFYRIPGLAASLALIFYVTLELILLNLLDITLTLPGVAGIVLSIGMAVDANVIIFTRIREELATGKTVASSMKLGFSKALSAIVDGNVTTLIAAAILAVLGSGTVKGFAYTLALGIILSMFTALFVTRFVLKALYQIGFDKEKFYGIQKERKVFDFIKLSPKCYILSGLVIVVGIVFLFINRSTIGGAFNYGLDFKGGTSTEVFFDGELPGNDEISSFVAGVIGDNEVDVAPVVGDNAVIIKTKELNLETRTALSEAFSSEYGIDGERITNESISAAVSGEMKRDAMLAVIIATLCMLIYIWIRFKDFSFGSSAVIALVHDVLVVVTLYAVIKLTVGTTFIACMLTIVGYSINATIVIFDRIRENKAEMLKKDTLEDVVNNSITQTVSRSINTSLTTFIMVFVLYLFGLDSVKEFALPLMVGVICGAYSSICITGALWYHFKGVFGKMAEKRIKE
ncbi:MAG: protein translocase subunit SecD [Lachnospiraceae bacterium]|jgi:SecD/SecF fusion protein|nr:protein translocase subunit SecD [Lachnospiraceae bacterium]